MNIRILLISWLVAIPVVFASSYVRGHDTAFIPPGYKASQEGLQLGWTDLLQANIKEPWPKRGNYRLVRYCYADDNARSKLDCIFQRALNLWSDALGGKASESTGHSLYFYELKEGGQHGKPMSCYTKYNSDTMVGVWNPLVPADTLAVYYKKETAPWATTGYVPSEVNDKPVRHVMVLHDLKDEDTHVVAHEMGHVLGMIHEQTRQDRDDHIEFRCSMIQGFFGSLMKAMGDGMSRDEAVKKLCEDMATAKKYDFASKEFMKGFGYQDKTIDGPSGFDFDSIMMYPSWAYAGNSQCYADLQFCTMAKIRKENGVKVGVERIEQPQVPSKMDAEFVKKWYPWDG